MCVYVCVCVYDFKIELKKYDHTSIISTNIFYQIKNGIMLRLGVILQPQI